MKHVLILDNDPDVLDIMQEALTYEGLHVTCIDEGNDILQLIRRHKPDLLMVDYLLNGINGGELCHQVKANPETHELPVIIMSAYPRVLLSLGTYNSDDFIAKPFDLEDMVDRIKKLTDGRRKRGLHVV
jgi:DNA-binding response OmpR family regulator